MREEPPVPGSEPATCRPQGALPRSSPPTVTECFLSWARHTPHAPAIREDGRVWRYGELAGTAAGIAARIRRAGCQPGDIVAIDGQRGGDFIAGLLGVLLARCTALPLDPGQPLAWCIEVLDQAGVDLLLNCGESRLPADRHPSLSIPPGSASVDQPDHDPTGEDATLDDPAYLFFTSGTTGRPKGVIGTHGGLGHFLAWQRETFAVDPGDRVAHVTGLSFDVVLREVFVALTAGAALSIPARHTLEDPRRFTRWLAEEGISLLHAVPTVADVWLSEAEPATRFPRLRATFFAGEPLSRSLVLRWRERTDAQAEIVNLYGPTETTLAKCWYRVPRLLPDDRIPVGRPLPECEIHLVDEAGRPVSPGEPGEVVIHTPWGTLAHLAGETPFDRHPSNSAPRTMIHPTGDRGRWLADGSLALLGRIDDQVKIRGVRVEPAGVAAVLASHPAVRACAVLALPTTQAQPRLTAYVVGTAERGELRRYLAERLVDAMIPTEFHFLDQLPRNANGKLDRARLVGLPAASEPPDTLPLTDSEQRIAAAYRERLGLPAGKPLSGDDDFFDLGGDSLQALAVISRINQGTDARLDVGDLFEAPDIRGLARRLDALRGTVPGTTAVPLQARFCPDRRPQRIPLSPAQERIWFQCQLEGDQATSYNVPVAIEIAGRLDVSALERALQAIHDRHEALRTGFPGLDGTACQVVGPIGPVPLPCIDLAPLPVEARKDALRRHAQRQAARPFRIDEAPLLRAELLRQGDDRHVLLLTVHHLVFDGWSRWLLIRELGEQYSAISRIETATRPASLPPLAIQYADYAVWSRRLAPRPESLSYWRDRLRDAPPIDLPVDHPRPVSPSFRGAQVIRHLSAGELAKIEALASRERATLYMLLLTAFKLVLARWSGGHDLTVGSPVANRPHPDLERLIGCFIETLPIRTDLSGGPRCVEALSRVRAAVVDAFTHADVPFEKIVEHVAPPRLPGRHPLFDVMFNLVNVPQGTADPEGLSFSFADWAMPEAKFDLSLYARKKQAGVELALVYKTALFKSDRMERLLDAVVDVLRQIVEDPRRPVASLRIALDGSPTGVPRALPPAPAGREPALAHVDPRNADEARVAAVYRALLGRETVSVHDNFFALGGHSLLAMQALSRLRREFDAALPLHLLFTCQTVAELAAAIRREPAGDRAGPEGGAPVTLGQRRLLTFMAANPCSAHYNVPRRIRLRGRLDPDRLERAIDRVAARHAVLSTAYRMDDGTGSPVRLTEAPIPLARIDVGALPDPTAAVDRLIAEEIARPFDLDAGPLLRAVLIRMAEEEHCLLITVHHVSADCWSMGMPFGSAGDPAGAWMAGVFFRQLWDAYRDPIDGRAAPSPPAGQFDTVARRQNAWLAGAEAARQLDYWKALLADRPRALEIPPDLPRPPVWDFQGERLPLRIEPEVASALRALAREHGTTLFVVLHAAFAVLLHGLTGAEDIVTGTTASNRAHWEADELIGFFSNNLPLRTSLAGDPDFREIVRRGHAAAFAAFAHQELPFERVLEGLGIAPPADRHPLFQIRFLLHLPADRPFEADGLSMTPVPTGREVAKYDLTLLLADGGDTLAGWLEYATSLYRRATAEDLLARYRRLLAVVAAEPGRPLSTLVAEAT